MHGIFVSFAKIKQSATDLNIIISSLSNIEYYFSDFVNPPPLPPLPCHGNTTIPCLPACGGDSARNARFPTDKTTPRSVPPDQHIGEFVPQIPPFPPGVLYTGKALFHADNIRLGDIHSFLPYRYFFVQIFICRFLSFSPLPESKCRCPEELPVILHITEFSDNKAWEGDYYRHIWKPSTRSGHISPTNGASHITRFLDGIAAEHFSAVFDAGLQLAQQYGALDRYQVLGTYHLAALDGVWFYQSGNVHCEHCLHHKRADGELLYYHDMAAAVLVQRGQETVVPLMPEFIRNEDGQGKQDCERNAAKRWFEHHAEGCRWLNPVFLGDDLYADYPASAGQLWKKGCIFCLRASLTAAPGCMIRSMTGV
jgi:hypothetical protein